MARQKLPPVGKRGGQKQKARKRFAVADRQREVAELYLQKTPQLEIARMLGVAQSTVSEDLAVVFNAWKREATDKLGLVKTREHGRLLREIAILEAERERLQWVENEARSAWVRSQRSAKTTRQEQLVKRDPETNALVATGDVRGVVISEEQVGERSFLDVVDDCIERRRRISDSIASLSDRICKLLGIYGTFGEGGHDDDDAKLDANVLVITIGNNGSGPSQQQQLPTAHRVGS